MREGARKWKGPDHSQLLTDISFVLVETGDLPPRVGLKRVILRR